MFLLCILVGIFAPWWVSVIVGLYFLCGDD